MAGKERWGETSHMSTAPAGHLRPPISENGPADGPVAGLVGIEGGVVSVVINLESPALKRRPGDHAMKNVTSKPELSHSAIETNSHLFDDWFDPIEDMIRGQVRGLIEEMIRGELDATLSRPRYGRLSHADGHVQEDRDRGAT